MFGKFFASAFTGSLFGAGPTVFAVWGYVIANARDSQVELNPQLLASILGTTQDDVATAIGKLCAPDPNSRSKEEDGRRLIKEGQFAYRVVNHAAYRDIRNDEERRAYFRDKKREQRLRDKQAQAQPQQGIGAPPQDAHIPTWDEVKVLASMRAIPETSARAFYDHHQGNNLWLNQHGKLVDWKANLKAWAAVK